MLSKLKLYEYPFKLPKICKVLQMKKNTPIKKKTKETQKSDHRPTAAKDHRTHGHLQPPFYFNFF
jgi:hypothetical protein